MLTLLSFVFVFGILVFVHEFGHFIVAKKMGVKVEEFALGFGKKILTRKSGDTLYCLCAIPLGGYVKMSGEMYDESKKPEPWDYAAKAIWKRFLILLAGPGMNYVAAFFIFSMIFAIGAPVPTARIGGLVDEYPAKAAGIQKNDVIVAVNGAPTELWTDMTDLIKTSKSKSIRLSVKRGDMISEYAIIPKEVSVKTILGKTETVRFIGIKPSEESVMLRYNPVVSLYKGGQKLWQLTVLTYQALWAMVTGQISAKDSMAGPIGIFVMTGEVAKLGFIYLLNLMGNLSLALAIFNILPIPVLDGGHMFFLLIEKIRGKALSGRSQEIVSQAGLFLLLTLLVFVSYFDISRFFFGK